jgi:hypothetical protein
MNLQFEPIDLDRQEDYLARLARCPQAASDYSFLNIWAWADEYGLSWAWDGPLVWIRQTRPQEVLWAPVGPWDDVDWRACFSDAGAETFIRVPEKLAEIWKAALGARVGTESERGHWDYVYAASDLIELPGNRYHKKKNLFNQFTKSTEFEYTDFSRKTIEQAMAMQADWCTWRDCESSEVLTAENRSILRVLDHWGRFAHILGGALFVENIIVAYTLAEPLTADTLVVHFEKGCPDYKGVYQAINQMFLARAAGGYRFVNREQDLDNEGLRKAKLSYHPVAFVKKFRVALHA